MEEINSLGGKLKALVGAAQNYHTILAENRKLYNEVLELKGNIRVYCRIRPFLPGQNDKPTAIDYIGENGELLLVNPSRQAKDGHRMFKFNKVFGQTATQAVPDASMVPVKTTSDVLELMQLGQYNRAVGSTAINERSSRSHSILTVHVRGVDLKTGSTSRGCLHLIDLAGRYLSRVKSAKKANKDGKDIKDLIEQVASLKDMIARKDEEIEHLKMLNDLRTQSHNSYSLCQSTSSPECSFGGISSQAGDATSQLLMFNGRNVYDNGNNDDGNGSSGNAKSNGRLSDASACDLSLGEEGEYSMGSTIESGVPPWTGKSSEIIKEKITKSSSRIHKSLPYRTGHGFPRRANSSDSLSSLFLKKPTSSQVATFNQMKG
ncbi:hypothetical protein HPP92_011218 [Vanilla planifolia]|uniref:Kinesin motor domain-containing protein n=1 Tax=Vanilla planifolia TaxID=51239 RepID=A0A835R6M3_VANPL|nr:hypothetical protein HPP92_011218 [Vanilla planifolia]